MNRQDIDQFQAHARKVSLPSHVKGAVLDKLADSGATSEPSPRPRQLVTRRAVIGTGLGLAGAAAALLALSVITRPDPIGDPTAAGGNFFALTAYAEGAPYGDSVIAKQMVGPAGSRGESSSGWYAARTLNFAVTGTGIKTITYRLEGDVVAPATSVPDDDTPLDKPVAYFDSLPKNRGEIDSGEALPDGGGTYDSFTVDYASQADDQNAFNRQIWTFFPTDDEIETLSQQKDALYEARDGSYESELAAAKASNAFWSLIERRSVDVLAQITLALDVTFENGDTQTKRYAIGTRDDYEDVVAEFDEKEAELSATQQVYRDDPAHQAEYDAAFQGWQDLMKDRPDDLFTLTEL